MSAAGDFREWRDRMGLSRYRVEQETGLGEQVLARIERGEVDPLWSTCMVLLEYVERYGGGLSLDALGGKEARRRLDALLKHMHACAAER